MIQNLNYIYNCNDVEALWMLRMKRAPFARLVETFRSRGLLQDNINTSVEEQVDMFLHVVGHNQRFRVIHSTFRRSKETISRYFKQVFFTIGELREEMTRRPSGQTPSKIRGSPRWYPYFKIALVQLMVLMSLPEFLGHCLQHTGGGNTTQARMCLLLLTLI
ncbi:uncharacterized protein LOC119365731 [Triticum dicoccoides]|uniref:uncharacterized protein LOC119365731 n=1 Tax=Triticum dicoccoides TaxID=85692 RepID=UPI001890875F|nr:uncharacterized protein LOC119365731 [Triticum dicoccoides]